MFAICMLNLAEIMSEFRESFLKTENKMEIRRIYC